MKLQKILYYLQGYYLSIFNDALFEDEIEAWKYGPVVCDEYHIYKAYGNSSIIVPEINTNFDYLTSDQKNFITKVYGYYRQFSSIKLMELTHQEEPWINAYGKSQFISKEQLKEFFSKSDLKNDFIIFDKKEERRKAAQFLLTDYLYDNDLIDSTISDTEDIYEH
ncbi:Panacea domain-containing protein [Chryseobacterium phocaeense]|uniref:Panacea domain-containing protein n=1 Tax=Chryseobacterium phocaeense TaxID=1816690 RepID=UPI0013EF3D61|nr:type II toxin-antitoxin system antitoxin SocA domain-containing protein [Chryseobacterium phocaeense]